MLFVPNGRKGTPIPCRHIPFNDEGYTLDNMYRWNTTEEIEATVKEWLKRTIAKLETLEHADQALPNGEVAPNSSQMTEETVAIKVGRK